MCCLLLLVLGRSKDKGLKEQLYEEAKMSEYMQEIISTGDALEEVLLSPMAPYILVMFHVSTCHICHEALPALETIAADWAKAKEPIVVYHIEVSNQAYWKSRFSFSGFPNLMLWHRQGANFADEAEPLLSFVKTANDGANTRTMVTKNESHLLDASRKALMSEQKDERRKRGLGLQATVERVELQDFTARVQVDGFAPKTTWYPLEALSYEDGSPVMRFQRPDNPVHYRPTSWDKEAMQDFAKRMMRPAVFDLKTASQLAKEMKDERLAAIVLCAGKIDDSPGFSALAKTWQDKHRAYWAASQEACPVSGGSRPKMLVYSASHHQWSSAKHASTSAAAAVAGADVAAKDATALSAWFDMHRFPGIWNVSYENFHMLIDAQRPSAVVAVDKTKQAELGKIDNIIKGVATPVTSKVKGEPDVWTYSANSTYWGVVDGFLNGLDHFGVLRSQLPRVVVFLSEDGSRQWVEDVSELSVWSLSADLKRLASMVRYSNDGVRGFFMTRLYRPLRDADRYASRAGGMPARVGVVIAFVLGLLLALQKLGRGVMSFAKMLMDSEEEPKMQKATQKKNN